MYIRIAIVICLIQYFEADLILNYTWIQDFEADFLLKVSLKTLNSGIILKTFTHAYTKNKSRGVLWPKVIL